LLKIFAFNNKFPDLYICTMLIGILIIIMDKLTFSTPEELTAHIDTYFNHVEGVGHPEKKPLKTVKQAGDKTQKKTDGEQIPATIAGLALFLGFNSRQEFDDYETKGKFADVLKRARLRIEAIYEKKLYQQSSPGTIFALKSLGRNEGTAGKTKKSNTVKVLKIKIIEAGPKLEANEKEVTL
jgi:hypothetical protein